jgi:hypothetical protein
MVCTVESVSAMANTISPLARLFRDMADLIDQDHTSQTRYEAITSAAAVAAARATTQNLVAGRLWEADGAGLLAAAYAFHAGLPRQAATASHVSAMQEPSPAPGPPARTSAAPVNLQHLPGPRLNHLGPADEARLWTALSDLRQGEVIPHSQLIRFTSWLPADLAAQLLVLLERGPALVGAEAARLRDAVDPNDQTTPVLAVITLGWLEAAEQVLTAGSTAHDLQVLLAVAGRQG